MGVLLGKPVTDKETASCGNNYVKVGSSSMQGWRSDMKDAHTQLLEVSGDKDACFFAVYDGHVSNKYARYAANHLHEKIIQSESYAQGNIEDAIRQGFLRVDEDMINNEEMNKKRGGTTAVVVLLKGNKIYCGNAGDSRAIASMKGISQPLSFDHKPTNQEESKRIIAAGGYVSSDHRVNNDLAMSRALGDFTYKRNQDKSAEEQIVTALPDVIVCDITDDHEFIVLACDGIWDVMTNQEVVDFCRHRFAEGMEPEMICEELMTHCLAPRPSDDGKGCDNMTVVLVGMLQNQTSEILRQKCARPRPPLDGDDSVTPILPKAPSSMNEEEHDKTPAGESEPIHVATTITDSINPGDQTVPEVAGETSLEPEPTERPMKQMKLNLEGVELASVADESKEG